LQEFDMKVWKILLVALALGATVAVLVGCNADPTTTPTSSAVAKVSRGNISVEITAAGNLALAHTEDLAFQLAGYVLSVDVEAGDSVTQGQELAKLDTTDYDKQIRSLNQAVTTAQHTLADKQTAVITAQRSVAALERTVADKESAVAKAQQDVIEAELAVQEAELNVQSAQDDLDSISDVKQIQDAIDADQDQIDLINLIIKGVMVGGFHVGADISYLNLQKSNAQATLAEDKQNLADLLDGTDVNVSQYIETQVAQANLKVNKMKNAVVDAQTDLNDDKTAVDKAKIAVDDAKYDVQQANLAVQSAGYDVDTAQFNLQTAQDNLEEAKSNSPIITAPFDGFIAKVNVAGGDEIYKGAVAMQIADPEQFEADILISEMDISQVEVGSRATITADALPGRMFPATVTFISPTATIQSGVVNYNVKIELENTSANMTTPSATAPPASENATGTLPAPLQQAVDSGRMTQEQAEAIAKQMQSGGGFMGRGNAGGQLPSGTTSANAKLRDGLTVTVTIMVAQSTNVLVVPNAAVTTQNGKHYVTVVNADGTTKQTEVQTGLSDWQNTEITSGLSEGEQVVVPKTTAVTTTTRTGGGMLFGGPPR
jgi:multidrug efflux pump subunit AcrA (membrane-fusion protein)